MCLEIIYLTYTYKRDLALNGFYAIKPNQTKLNQFNSNQNKKY